MTATGSPEAIAGAVPWLVRDARYDDRPALPVDGGWLPGAGASVKP